MINLCCKVHCTLTFIFSFSGIAILSFLPETSFCFLRGTCRTRVGPGRFYDSYRAHWKNHRRQPEYDDYYYDSEPEFFQRKGMEAKQSKQKRDADYDYEDVALLPAEHRQLTPGGRPRRQNPM